MDVGCPTVSIPNGNHTSFALWCGIDSLVEDLSIAVDDRKGSSKVSRGRNGARKPMESNYHRPSIEIDVERLAVHFRSLQSIPKQTRATTKTSTSTGMPTHDTESPDVDWLVSPTSLQSNHPNLFVASNRFSIAR